MTAVKRTDKHNRATYLHMCES